MNSGNEKPKFVKVHNICFARHKQGILHDEPSDNNQAVTHVVHTFQRHGYRSAPSLKLSASRNLFTDDKRFDQLIRNIQDKVMAQIQISLELLTHQTESLDTA